MQCRILSTSLDSPNSIGVKTNYPSNAYHSLLYYANLTISTNIKILFVVHIATGRYGLAQGLFRSESLSPLLSSVRVVSVVIGCTLCIFLCMYCIEEVCCRPAFLLGMILP
ncbi:hypothetical protein BDU57DRAFT_519778 [Ampelomyces quisqualis]|uniref:Uncharacterized protein n=1 Tax=Ampelomyces quisqualis TaxID=50730 RepID=A0A6A5QGM3_AMPQU|nr:hypothetical protein BDU57DRAFT_519778 [Ampelomyces quisqualis]